MYLPIHRHTAYILHLTPYTLHPTPYTYICLHASPPTHAAVFLDDQGKVWTCGKNQFGECGQGDFEEYHIPKQVQALDKHTIVKIACGQHHTVVLSGTLRWATSPCVLRLSRVWSFYMLRVLCRCVGWRYLMSWCCVCGVYVSRLYVSLCIMCI